MKKLLSLVLAVVMVLGLVACGGDTPATTAPNGSTPAETTAPAADATYTYNYALAEFPTNWNTTPTRPLPMRRSWTTSPPVSMSSTTTRPRMVTPWSTAWPWAIPSM